MSETYDFVSLSETEEMAVLIGAAMYAKDGFRTI